MQNKENVLEDENKKSENEENFRREIREEEEKEELVNEKELKKTKNKISKVRCNTYEGGNVNIIKPNLNVNNL